MTGNPVRISLFLLQPFTNKVWYNRVMRTKTDTATRFMTKINKTPSGCWEWIASTDRDGYGNFNYPTSTSTIKRAHRASYDYFYGGIPEGMQVLHKCDNPPCVNPTHLYLGSNQQNVNDREDRNRNHKKNKTHCPQGHPFDTTHNTSMGRGKLRRCSICTKASQKKAAAKRRAAKKTATKQGENNV